MLDPGMKRPSNTPQQSLRHRRRQRQRQPTSRPHHVASRIERALNQQKRGRAEHPSPKRKLANEPRVLRVQCKPLRPVPKRRPPRRKLRHAPARQHQDRKSPPAAGTRPPLPPQAAQPPAANRRRLPPHPAANATHRDDQAQPAAHRSDPPRANTPAPAAASPGETARSGRRAPAASASLRSPPLPPWPHRALPPISTPQPWLPQPTPQRPDADTPPAP